MHSRTFALCVLLASCDCGSTGAELDSSVSGSDSAAPSDATSDGASVDANTTDAAQTTCVPVECGGRTYACGNCLDDDNDGTMDSRDFGCVGACDDTEDSLALGIPGGDVGRCDRDCYYDTNQGPGNDGCGHDVGCDERLRGPQMCAAVSGDACNSSGPEQCATTCAAITPNGCDCFGCCERPEAPGSFVFLGSRDSTGAFSCDAEHLNDATRCHPCTTVTDFCRNTCERCELCFGRRYEDLPLDCRPGFDGGTPDGGTDDAGTGAPDGEAGSICPTGVQVCDVPGASACPAGQYCLTGCCQSVLI